MNEMNGWVFNIGLTVIQRFEMVKRKRNTERTREKEKSCSPNVTWAIVYQFRIQFVCTRIFLHRVSVSFSVCLYFSISDETSFNVVLAKFVFVSFSIDVRYQIEKPFLQCEIAKWWDGKYRTRNAKIGLLDVMLSSAQISERKKNPEKRNNELPRRDSNRLSPNHFLLIYRLGSRKAYSLILMLLA